MLVNLEAVGCSNERKVSQVLSKEGGLTFTLIFPNKGKEIHSSEDA